MDAISVGGLVIEELVVTGGFSQVYRAWDPRLERAVAIKVFRLDSDKEAALPLPREAWRRRFVAEARLLAALDHPHLVRVNGLHQADDSAPAMVMPWYVANLQREIGRDIADPEVIAALPPLQRPRPAAPARAADILRQLCLGLAALHGRGIVHRDVKPSNLLLTARENGRIRLCDLGLAKLPDEVGQDLARPGLWLGTPNYAAPEQMEDAAAVDDRADVYSVGVLGFRLLAGRLPAPGEAPLGQGALGGLIADAMAPVPGRRPTALQLAARLSGLGMQSATAIAETW